MKTKKLILLIGVILSAQIFCFANTKEIKITFQAGCELFVDNQPFLIKGVSYNPTPIGQGYDYDLFSDPAKPWLIDGKLMQEAGINCVRIYSTGTDLEKTRTFIKDMYDNFGIYTIVSDWLGLWDYPGPSYAEKEFQDKTKTRVLKLVSTLKDEPGVLMWILGNENNYTFSGKLGYWTSPEIEAIRDPAEQIAKKAEIYYSFVNDLAQEIKNIDSNHPIALGNGEATSLDIAGKICANIDVLAIIAYRGKKFGNLFNNVSSFFDKPILLSEFGCDSYDAFKGEENQDIQAEFLLSQWNDLYSNTVMGGNSAGKCLGGVTFEWNDEWWKHSEGYTPDWNNHNSEAGWSNGSYYFDIRAKDNLNINEEWFGIVSLSKEMENNINKRIPKKSYTTIKECYTKCKTTTEESTTAATESTPLNNENTNK